MARARKKTDPFHRKVGSRNYRKVYWISAEGKTERDYFSMRVFKDLNCAVRFPKDIHPSRRSPRDVLKRFQKALRSEDFRQGDEAWLVVDIDNGREAEFPELSKWRKQDGRHHVAISNPKFELFLVMHFESAGGCTTPEKVDAALKRYMPNYDKRIASGLFSEIEVRAAMERSRAKRRSCSAEIPDAGMTDVHLLVERLLEEAKRTVSK